jgi:excisionase family DNA binding protein
MITTKEAAKLLGVERQTVRKYITNGLGKGKEKLKAMLIMHGRRKEYRIKLSDLEDYKKKYLSI